MAQTGWNWVSARKAGRRATYSCISNGKLWDKRCRPPRTTSPSCFQSPSTISWTPFQLMGFAGMDLTCERVYGGTWAALSLQLCSTMCPFTTRSAFMCSCHAPRISRFCVKKEKTNKQTNKQWFHWDCAVSVRYRIGLVAKTPLCSTLCRSSMTTSAIWKEAFRQHVVINSAFAPRALTFCCRLAISVGCFALNG